MQNIFRPSKKLDPYLYSIFLEYASIEELENDVLHTNTHWQIVKHYDEYCDEYEVWFDNGIGVTEKPLSKKIDSTINDSKLQKQNIQKLNKKEIDSRGRIINSKKVKRFYDSENPNNPLNGIIIAPNIEV